MSGRFAPLVAALSATIALGAIANVASADIVGPYTVDANTLHLWHLDETLAPAADQAHYNYAGTFTTKPDSNQPLSGLANGATLGNASFTGFGTALSTATASTNGVYPASSSQPLFGALSPINGTADNADHTFDNPTTHAFTMEAVIRIGFNPASTWAAPQEIIAGEGDASDSSDRSWQFRLEAHTNTALPWVLRFQKVTGFGGVGGSNASYNLDAALPTTGDDALVQGEWYHVAVTYTGVLSDPTSLKLYWTHMNPANVDAHQVAAGNMNGWLRQQDTDFALGNELRDFNGETEPFQGLIDEVRISDVSRGFNDMQFAPEPASLSVLGLAGAALLIRRRR